jgi:hypothetical protein
MRLVLVIAATLVPNAVPAAPAPTAAEGSWLVAVNTGGWFATFDQDAGGVGVQAAVAKAVQPHLLVGGRITGLTAIDLSDPPKQNVPTLFDVGPIIGTGASWSRLSLSASAGPLLTHVKQDADGWKSSWTVGLGLDAGVTIRTVSCIGIGVHVAENLNRERSATAVALRLEGSVW